MKWWTLPALSLATFVAVEAKGQEWEDAPPEPGAEVVDVDDSPSEAAPPVREPVVEPAKRAPREPEQHRHRHHDRDWRRRGDGSVSISLGKARLDADALDERLAQHGYAPISDRAFQVGLLGMKAFPSGLVLGFGASYTMTKPSDGPGDSELRASIGHVYGLLGGAAVRTRRWFLAPAVMLGGYHMKLEIDSSDSASFDQVLDDPERGVTLSEAGWFAGGMIVLDRRFPWRDGSRFTSFGVRLGVMESLSANGWRFGDDRAGGAPEALPRVGFLAIALGFGRYAR